jgi:hypothetical protein
LQKKGLAITETEADKLYEELRLERKSKLESRFKKGYIGGFVIGVLLIAGLYFAFKKKK